MLRIEEDIDTPKAGELKCEGNIRVNKLQRVGLHITLLEILVKKNSPFSPPSGTISWSVHNDKFSRRRTEAKEI